MADSGFTPRVSARHLRQEQVQVDFRRQSFICDHPPQLWGDDMGPTPGELVLGGLAASMAQHLGRHARERQIPMTGCEVKTDFEVGQEPNPGHDLDPLAFLSAIKVVVEIHGELSEQQFQTLRYIAQHCVVANTLRRGVEPTEQVVLVRSGDTP